MKLKIGNTYVLPKGSCSEEGFVIEKESIGLIVDTVSQSNGPGSKKMRNLVTVFVYGEDKLLLFQPTQLNNRLNIDSLETLRQFHTKNIKNIDSTWEVLKDIGQSEIDESDYLAYVALKTLEKDGATVSQRLKSLKAALESV